MAPDSASREPPADVCLWGTSALGDAFADDSVVPEHRQVLAPWTLSTLVVDPAAQTREWVAAVHHEHELLWCEGRAITVEARGQVWLVPPTLGIWLPAGTVHRVTAHPDASVFAAYLDTSREVPSWESIVGVPITPLLHELLLHNRRAPMPEASRHALQALAVEQMVPLTAATIELRLPRDPALRVVADRVVRDPGDGRSLDEWASSIGMSPRTFMRRFLDDTGSTFAQWRILARVAAALTMLAEGRTVASVVVSPELVDTLDADAFVLVDVDDTVLDDLMKDELFANLPSVVDGRVVQVIGMDYAMATSAPTVLSIPYALDEFVTQLTDVLG